MRRALKKRFKCTLTQWVNLRDKTELHCTALHLAAFSGDNKLIALLVENGADLQIRTMLGVNALHMAA